MGLIFIGLEIGGGGELFDVGTAVEFTGELLDEFFGALDIDGVKVENEPFRGCIGVRGVGPGFLDKGSGESTFKDTGAFLRLV